jgi:hypothetical protein
VVKQEGYHFVELLEVLVEQLFLVELGAEACYGKEFSRFAAESIPTGVWE